MSRFDARQGFRWVLVVLTALLLSGCAGERLQREGIALLDAGQMEEGLVKLAESSKAEPHNLAYRAALLRNRELAVHRLLAQAAKARAAGQPGAARSNYEKILRIDPANNNARVALGLLDMDLRHGELLADARQALKGNDADAARGLVKRVLLENPDSAAGLLLQRQIDDMSGRSQGVPAGLQGKFKKPVTLQFREANIKTVFEALSGISGVNVMLDKDVKADQKITIFVKDVSVEDAIDLILLQSQLEKKVISDTTLLVYPNTPAKLKDYQDLKIRSFHLVNADAKQILAMIKTLLKSKDIVVNEKTNSVLMRDTPEAVALAARLVEDQDIADPEVMLELEVVEISRSRLSEIGLKLPNTLTLAVPGADGLTLDALRNTKGGSLLVAPAPSVSLNLLLQDGDSNLLASPRIRARNHEKARIMIGDRVPVLTNAVTPVSTGTPVITGSVQYLDVGLKLEVEPEIHLDNEVSIKINLEVSSIVKEVQNVVSGTLAYQVGTRNATTVLRLKDGETQILGGLISDDDRNSAGRVPLLGQLPLLGRLFSNQRDDARKTEIVLSITPHVIGTKRLADARNIDYWSGTETNLRSSPLLMHTLGTVAVSGAPAPVGAAPSPATAAAPAPAAVPEGAPVTLSWQGPSQAKVGERISVSIQAQTAQPLHSLEFVLDFDPAVLRVLELADGNFLRQNSLPATFTKEIDPAGGHVALALAAAASGTASGTGSVANIVFEALAAAPHTGLAIGQVKPAGPSGEALAARAPAPHALEVLP